jgi:hypothetical protein
MSPFLPFYLESFQDAFTIERGTWVFPSEVIGNSILVTGISLTGRIWSIKEFGGTGERGRN